MDDNKEKKDEQLDAAEEPNTEQVEDIIKFYEQEDTEDPDYDTPDEEIHDSSYGLNRRGRSVVRYIATAVICVAIIAASYAVAIFFPVNDEATEEYADTLRENDSYKSVSEEYSRLTAEVKALSKTVSEKKEQTSDISEPENTKAELREKIAKKAEQLKEINDAVKKKNEQIEAADTEIASVSGMAVTLSPGRYTVGKDIAPGKYSIMGYGSFAAASSGGASKYNTKLGSTPVEVELSSGDKLRLDCTVKFTPTA